MVSQPYPSPLECMSRSRFTRLVWSTGLLWETSSLGPIEAIPHQGRGHRGATGKHTYTVHILRAFLCQVWNLVILLFSFSSHIPGKVIGSRTKIMFNFIFYLIFYPREYDERSKKIDFSFLINYYIPRKQFLWRCDLQQVRGRFFFSLLRASKANFASKILIHARFGTS